ncbi:MAG: hypothetical protein N4A40_16095 [Tissierellales bacterium]|nr:hypothetical protein [Tissierellales bacterium]
MLCIKKILVFGLMLFMGINSMGGIAIAEDVNAKNIFRSIENIESSSDEQFTRGGTYIEYRLKDDFTNKSYDTVWQYKNDKDPVLVAKAERLRFLACELSGNIAILDCKSESARQIKDEEALLKVLDDNKNIIFDKNLYSAELEKFFDEHFEGQYIDRLNLSLEGWSDDGKYLWIEDSNNSILFRINIYTKKVDILDKLYFYTDSDFNCNTGWACDSNYPELFDSDGFEQMRKKNPDINLKLVNVLTGEEIDVATKKAARFSPKWVDNRSIMYQDANGDWVIYRMKNSDIVSNAPLSDLVGLNIFLYPVEASAKDGLYRELILSINNKSKKFKWENVTYSHDHSTSLDYYDINGDQKEELIVLLTKNNGPGTYINDIHIINPVTFEEIEVENPINILENNVNTKVYEDKVEVEINDEIFIVPKEKIDLDTKYWADKVMYKNYRCFDIKHNKIVATLDLNIGNFSGYFGIVEIVYDFKDGKYVMDKIDFKEHRY